VVIVPIIKKDAERDAVLEAVKVLHTAATAAGLRAHLDADEGRTPGWKFNFWEMKVSWGNCCIRLTDSDMPMDGREPHMKLEVRLLKVCGTAALEGSTGLGAAVWTPQWTPQDLASMQAPPACRCTFLMELAAPESIVTITKASDACCRACRCGWRWGPATSPPPHASSRGGTDRARRARPLACRLSRRPLCSTSPASWTKCRSVLICTSQLCVQYA